MKCLRTNKLIVSCLQKCRAVINGSHNKPVGFRKLSNYIIDHVILNRACCCTKLGI